MARPCPCCGYKTLPDLGGDPLCPVCWWDDDRAPPWEVSDANGQSLIEAQQRFLAQRRPYRLRPGKVRAPRRDERRDPDWLPFELTGDLVARIEHSTTEWQHRWDEKERRARYLPGVDPQENPLTEYNAAVQALKVEASLLPHREVRERLRDLGQTHGLMFSNAHLELLSRRLLDAHWHRRHPAQALWWLVRYSRPSTFRQRARELRTGVVYFAG